MDCKDLCDMKGHDECARHGRPPPAYEVSAGDPGDIQVRIDAAPDAVVEKQKDSATAKTRSRRTPFVAAWRLVACVAD